MELIENGDPLEKFRFKGVPQMVRINFYIFRCYVPQPKCCAQFLMKDSPKFESL